MSEQTLMLAAMAMAFLSVALVTVWIGGRLNRRGLARERLQLASSTASGASTTFLPKAIRDRIEAGQFGQDPTGRARQRLELIKAGFFSADAVLNYTLLRMLLVLFLPALMYLLVISRYGYWGLPI